MNPQTDLPRIVVRLATPEDAEGIRRIYAPFAHTPVTFEEEEPDPREFRARMEGILGFYPGLVACVEDSSSKADGRSEKACDAKHTGEDQGAKCADKPHGASCGNGDSGVLGGFAERVVGFAYAHRQAERAAYDWNAELSVYLAEDATGRGLGTALYQALLDLLSLQGIRNAYGRVTVPNAASERLHERLGFERAWVQKDAGFKNGAWRDVAWFAKRIGTFDANPARPVPFPALVSERAEEVRHIVADANERITR